MFLLFDKIFGIVKEIQYGKVFILRSLKISFRSPWLTLAAVIGAGGCLGLLSLYFSTGSYGLDLFRFYLTQPMVLVMNLIPFVLLGLLLLALCGRGWLAVLLNGLVCLFFSWAQYWKLMARNDPIYAVDLAIFTEATQMAGQYIQVTWQILLSAGLLALCVAVMLLFRGRLQRLLPRLALGATVIVLGGVLFRNYYIDQSFYNTFSTWPQLSKWADTTRYISRGGIYPFLYSIPDAIPTPPEGYDEESARELLESYPSDDIPREQQVSIIMTQLEAFTDLSALTDKITAADPYAAYHALLEESYHGQLLPNIFAGGTIDTERCVLTGFSVLEQFRRPSWSYARYFAEQGYTVEGAHAGYEAFYNRRNINENLGIPNYRFIENYYQELVQGVPMDNVFLPDVTAQTLAAMEDGPVFSFNVTYQNHGPYNSDRKWFQQEYVPAGLLSDGDYHIINNYLDGVRSTAELMQAMVEAYRRSEHPVVLVFFGDHKPWLGEQSVTYDALGIDIRSSTQESFFNYYATDYIIWANDAAKALLNRSFVGTGPTISPCFLMNVLFEQCGWEGPGYQKFTDQVMAATPLLHTTKRYLVDGLLVGETGLDEQTQTLLARMNQAQYYLAQDSGGLHP